MCMDALKKKYIYMEVFTLHSLQYQRNDINEQFFNFLPKIIQL